MLLSATLSVLWFLCGLIAVITMLLLLGGKPDASSRATLKWNHRIFGGFFSLGYIIFAVIMVSWYQGNAPFLTGPIATHSYLGIILLPILFIKHYIVRIAKRYYPALPYIGMTMLVIAFLIVAPTGVNRIILWTKVPKMTVQTTDGPRIVSTAIGRDFLAIKCARCHDLISVYKGKRGEEEWRKTIKRMTNYDKALRLTEDHRDHIVGYLLLER